MQVQYWPCMKGKREDREGGGIGIMAMNNSRSGPTIKTKTAGLQKRGELFIISKGIVVSFL
jgi:hypothetical protein